MSISREALTYEKCVATVLSSSPTPLSIDELLGRIKEMRPVDGDGSAAVHRAVNRLFQAVPVTPGRFGWLSFLLSGTTFRHPLIGQEIKKGYMMLDELEHSLFFPEFFQHHQPQERRLTIDLLDGPTLSARSYIEHRTWSLALGSDFSQWILHCGGQHDDAVIIHVIDAVEGRYLLRLQPREARDSDEIEQRNIAYAQLAESIVGAERRARPVMAAHELAARLIARDSFRDPVPPDDMHFVMHHFSRLELDDDGYRLGDASPSRERIGDSNESDIDRSVFDMPSSLFGWQKGKPTGDTLWDWMEMADGPDEIFPGDDETCHAYQHYLDRYDEMSDVEPRLSHEEFHMLEAELEYTVALEVEFGWLLPEQEMRKHELAQRLLLDPDSLTGGEMGPPDLDGPPYWEN